MVEDEDAVRGGDPAGGFEEAAVPSACPLPGVVCQLSHFFAFSSLSRLAFTVIRLLFRLLMPSFEVDKYQLPNHFRSLAHFSTDRSLPVWLVLLCYPSSQFDSCQQSIPCRKPVFFVRRCFIGVDAVPCFVWRLPVQVLVRSDVVVPVLEACEVLVELRGYAIPMPRSAPHGLGCIPIRLRRCKACFAVILA